MQENQNLFSLSIDPVTKSHLTDIYKWTRFLAITGMLVLFLGMVAVLVGATVSTEFTSMGGMADGQKTELTGAAKAGMAITSVIVIAIAFFPLLFLLQFSNKMKTALAANDQASLNWAFSRLKTYFKYLGIMTIIAVVFYALLILLTVMKNANN